MWSDSRAPWQWQKLTQLSKAKQKRGSRQLAFRFEPVAEIVPRVEPPPFFPDPEPSQPAPDPAVPYVATDDDLPEFLQKRSFMRDETPVRK